jgi:hypothetical protein
MYDGARQIIDHQFQYRLDLILCIASIVGNDGILGVVSTTVEGQE